MKCICNVIVDSCVREHNADDHDNEAPIPGGSVHTGLVGQQPQSQLHGAPAERTNCSVLSYICPQVLLKGIFLFSCFCHPMQTMTLFRLVVSKAAEGQPLVKNVSLLSGLVVSILLLLLSCSLLVLLTLRRRKRSRRESSLVNGSHALPPIYRLDTPLLLQRESLGRDCELGETPRWASQRYPTTPTTMSHSKMFTSPGPLLQPLLTSPSSITSAISSIDSFIDLTGQADAFTEPCLPTEDQQSVMTSSPRLGGGSVPHLATRRCSSSARPTPPPRPPRSARSLGQLHNAKEEDAGGGGGGGGGGQHRGGGRKEKEGRRRRKTAPARSFHLRV